MNLLLQRRRKKAGGSACSNLLAAGRHPGIFSAPAALELYAEVFEAAGAEEKLEPFASHYGADFYRLPRNSGSVTVS